MLSSYTSGSFNPRAPCGARRCRIRKRSLRSGFNPRAPCGARLEFLSPAMPVTLFQSTRPVWGATANTLVIIRHLLFQSTRPVWGATAMPAASSAGFTVSIHAPRVGRDGKYLSDNQAFVVSIHAPRVGRDSHASGIFGRFHGFNPRAPCGARPSGLLDVPST